MFNLRRYFSITCAAALVVVTVVLLVLYRQSALDELVEAAEGQNVTLARSFANILWPRFADYVMSVPEVDGDTLRARPETRELQETLRTLMVGHSVLKVKVYNLDGLTVYSSQPSQMGANNSNNQGFLKSAREGKPASKLSYRDTFSAFSGTVKNRDLVESYLPIWGRDGAIDAVFELYTDVTPSMARIERRMTRLMLGIMVTFGLFYGVLFLIIRRADRILKRQYVDLLANRESIKEKNSVLEHEVAERTRAEAALRETHDTLEQRVAERTDEIYEANADLKREISERKNSELALRENQQRLNSIMNSVVDGVITYDGDGFIQSFNQAAEKIFGHSMIEVLNKSVRILRPEPNAGDDDHHLSTVFNENAATSPGIRPEITGQRKDGTTFPLEISISRMDLPGQSMFVGICRDITRRKEAEAERARLEQELSQAQKLESLGTLAGGIAHEINTPVQFVGDNTRFLKGAFSDLSAVLQKHLTLLEAATAGGDLTEAVAQANAAAEAADMDYLVEDIPNAIEHALEGLGQIAEIVQAIKEFSYPNTQEKKPIDINHAITTTITVSRNQWKYAAELTADLEPKLPMVPCLPGEFNQVILNLIVNAAHAIEDGGDESKGRIAISTRKLEGWIEIRVSDTGSGIPKENRDKIFEPFFTTKEPGKGTGQGLSISHTIITKKHGGTLTFNSEVGEGTVFVIRLPLSDRERSEVAVYAAVQK